MRLEVESRQVAKNTSRCAKAHRLDWLVDAFSLLYPRKSRVSLTVKVCVFCGLFCSVEITIVFLIGNLLVLHIIENHLIPQALQGQISSQQAAVEKLKKTAEVLLDAKGSLLPAKNDIQKTLGEVLA